MIAPHLPTIADGTRSTSALSTCTRLLALAGLQELLRSEGDYTLFAPTDEAFDNLPPGALQSLESDPAELRAVLEYHILGVGRELSQLRNGKLQTLQGMFITASVTDDGLQVDHANTRGYPMRCANGVIHQIDAVLFPGFTPQLSAKAREDSAWSGRRRISQYRQTAAQQEAESIFVTPAKTSDESAPSA